jgi:UDP-N-acetylmuramyl pentapeptide synthase
MLELGGEAEVRHRAIGELLAETGVHRVYLRGRLSRMTAEGAVRKGMSEHQITHFSEPREILGALLALMTAGDWVLIKGSRGMKMEEIVDAMVQVIGREGDDALHAEEATA